MVLSDIVTFTVISSKCKPSQIVEMLAELYAYFDKLVDKYQLYKVFILNCSSFLCVCRRIEVGLSLYMSSY